VRFRDTRPEPKDGGEDKRTAGQIIASAFASGGAVRLSRGFGGKDPNRTPMALRYQAALRGLLAQARKGVSAKLTKRTVTVEAAR
jgi:hypothetical protein